MENNTKLKNIEITKLDDKTNFLKFIFDNKKTWMLKIEKGDTPRLVSEKLLEISYKTSKDHTLINKN